MMNPFVELGVPPNSDDATIRQRYLELIKEFTPEHHPARFAAIRQAYDAIKSSEDRIKYRLFEMGKADSIDSIIEELECQMPRRRIKLEDLIRLQARH